MAKREDRNGKRHADRRRKKDGGADRHAGVPQLVRAQDHHDLLVTLTRELFQTERSASLHPIREAERLGDVPPAHALRRVAEHAADILARLPLLARAHALPVSTAGQRAGELFSHLREAIADRLIDPERSYRGSLLGMRHGIDLVRLMRATARAAGDDDLETWCGVWLDEREPLVEACAEQLAWFASHPVEAQRSRSLFPQSLFAIMARDPDPAPARG
jgi:hypothetical protein